MEIENLREEVVGSNLATLFDIYLPAAKMRLRNFRIIPGKKGKFVSSPSFKTTDREGNPKYIPYFEFSEEKNKEFMKKVYETLKDKGII